MQIGGSTGFPYSKDRSLTLRVLWSLFPPNTFSHGLKLLSDATSTPQDPGISWSKRAECAPNDDIDCVITIVSQLLQSYYKGISNNCVKLLSDITYLMF